METKKRSLAKAINWRLFATLITGGLVWVLSGRLEFSVTVGVIDMLIKIVVYYGHERLWLKISFGKAKPPEYEI